MRAVSRLPASDKEVAFLLFLGYVSCCMFGVSLGVALPQVMVEFSINQTQAGWLYSASLWSTAVLLVPSGYLADRFGQKRLLLWGYLLAIIGVTGLAFSQGYLGCLLALLTAGAGLGLVVPPYYAMAGEVLKRVRGLAVGFAASGYYLGGAVGPILVGFFVSQQQWRSAYCIIAAVMFVMMAVQFVRVRPPPTRAESHRHPAVRSSFTKMLRVRNVFISSVSILLANIGLLAAAAWLPTFLLSVIGLDATSVGVALGFLMLTGVVSSPVVGALSDRISRRRVACISGIASAVISIPMLTTQYSFWSSLGYSLMFGFLLLPAWNLLVAIVQESADEEAVTSVTGITQAFGVVGSAAGPIVASSLIAVFGINQALIYSITLPAFSYGILALTLVETREK